MLEPDPDRDTGATVAGRYRWEYPDFPGGNADTETAFFLAGNLTVVSKTAPSRAYRFDGCDIVLLSERRNVWLLANHP